MSKLSKLFSENSTPYIDYRLVENLFCKYFGAENDARLCTAFDARLGELGIGIKTFILEKEHKIEKIAEFNKLKGELDKYSGRKLAIKLGEFRNERMDLSIRAYGIKESIYHIVGRSSGKLEIFNVPYVPVRISEIGNVRTKNNGSISFEDGENEYSFNNSKSVLMMKFKSPGNKEVFPVNILNDPFSLLEKLLSSDSVISSGVKDINRAKKKGYDYVILPLYSSRGQEKKVPEKSGLNQWNASGRRRSPDEVYIPIPRSIHQYYPNFFPNRETPFELLLPDGKILNAKVCQDGGKALMTNPNSELGKWLLRDMLKLDEYELVTIDVLNRFGIDSILIEKRFHKDRDPIFALSFQSGGYDTYEDFISGNLD